MEYISVLWKYQNKEDPVRLVSELGEDRFERRKLEFFADGTVDAASGGQETMRTRLGSAAVPLLVEINEAPEFDGMTISTNEFEALWREHSGHK